MFFGELSSLMKSSNDPNKMITFVGERSAMLASTSLASHVGYSFSLYSFITETTTVPVSGFTNILFSDALYIGVLLCVLLDFIIHLISHK